MVKTTSVYHGDKHCDITHEPSSARIGTDAPKDNHGKGELFSPTDLLGAAMGSCMLTTMAINCEKDNVSLKGSWASVEKEMAANPRRIAKLHVVLHLPQQVPHDYRKKLEAFALGCPVKESLRSDLDVPVIIHYDV
ncbi:MAG: OsmC family protein [Bdellovibrio sp.]|nr:OsmC family protein [Bdellovibrio sp.]